MKLSLWDKLYLCGKTRIAGEDALTLQKAPSSRITSQLEGESSPWFLGLEKHPGWKAKKPPGTFKIWNRSGIMQAALTRALPAATPGES